MGVKPAAFEYHAPTSLEQVLSLLAEYRDDAKVLSGGQSLVPLLNMRLARPAHLIDIGKVPGLGEIRVADGKVRVGARVTHAALEYSPEVDRACPLIPTVIRHIGHLAIRCRGTAGGSLAHADPTAEWPLLLTLLQGRVLLSRLGGERWLDASEFFLTYLTTAREPDELLTEVELPLPPDGWGWAFTEVARRHGDFAIAAAGALVELDRGRISHVRLVLGGVGPGPVDASSACSDLLGRAPAACDLAAVGARVAETLSPDEDLHASAEYRRTVAGTLTSEVLQAALARTK